MQALLDAMSRIGLRRELEVLGGYDTGVTGQRLDLTQSRDKQRSEHDCSNRTQQ